MKQFRPVLFSLLFLLSFTFSSCFAANQDELSALIEKARILISQKAYQAGIAVLETVLREDPKNEKAIGAFLEACDTYSQKLIAENKLEQAQVYIKKMGDAVHKIDVIPSEVMPGVAESQVKREISDAKFYMADSNGKASTELIAKNSSREQLNEAIKYFKKREYGMAENLLQDVVSLDPKNASAYILLGEIANLNQKLDEAETYYKKAFSLNPDPRWRERYEKLLREKSIDKNQQEYEDEHFVIRYKRSEDLPGSTIRDYLREAYRTVSQDFAYYPDYKVSVIMYDEEEYQKLMGSVPHWSSGLYDGKIRLPIYQNEKIQNDLKKLIFHELTHSFVLDLSKMQCPIWLNEGLAQYEENKAKPVPLQILAKAARTHSLMSIDEMMFLNVGQESSGEKALLFYAQSFSLTSYLIEEFRMYPMKQLLIELGDKKPFLEAFEKVYGRTFQDVASAWLEDLKRQYQNN